MKTRAFAFALVGLLFINPTGLLAREQSLQERLDAVIDSAIAETRVV
jgi:hypothetical protein